VSGRIIHGTRIGGRLDRWVVLPHGVERLMLVTDEMRKCVVFVYRFTGGQHVPAGTAFFLAKHVPEYPDHVLGLLLTAAHVIDGVKQLGEDGHVSLRFNTREGRSLLYQVPTSAWHQPEDAVDLAVCLGSFDHTRVEFRAFNVGDGGAATDEIIKSQQIGIGDEVFMVGLFRNHLGRDRNEPVLRVGNIAAMPQDEVRTALGPMRAILIEARSIGGLSGSPVFVHMGFARWREGQVVRSGTPSPFFFLGLMHGHWDVSTEAIDAAAPDAVGENVNTGIGIVVPAEQIMRILNPIWDVLLDARKQQLDEDSGSPSSEA
jgi:hypothetical protein